ncbi:hypothetical protein V500_00046 [Pseudogymnoascus sp. VKM F-4518 (FW-2643)]|nr:hypothetical protein V500_00046 [Pseudogymnoascus sp. VKM F-4518 (FW-2643)]
MLDRVLGFGGSKNGALGIPRSLKDGERDRGSLHRKLPDWTETFPEIDTTNTTGSVKSHNATIQGVVVATFVLGALAGALSCMYTGDIFGRRKNIFAAAALTVIGEVLCSSSYGLPQFIIGRTVIGLGTGVLSATVPVWQTECSSAANRGKHVVLDGLFITLGYTLESWINLGASQIKGSNSQASWRMPLAIPIAFSIILMSCIFFMPESPRWLIKVGRVQEARVNLSKLKDVTLDDPILTAEIEGIQYALEESTVKKASMADMFTMGPEKLFYRFCLCIMLQFYQQMSGSNLISVYASVIFQQNLKLDGQTARILTGGTLTWKFLSSFVAFFTIDRYGRRALFMFSGVGMGSCMLALAVSTSYPTDNKPASIASVFFIFMYNFFVPIGFLGANFLYCAEIAPVKLRVSMASISTANHWLWNFVVVMATPVAIADIGSLYFIVFAVVSFCIPLSVYFFYPETMGQSLEQIDAVFRDNNSPMAIVKASKLLSQGNIQTILSEKDQDIAKHVEKTKEESGTSTSVVVFNHARRSRVCYTLDVSFTVEVGVAQNRKGRRARARFERKCDLSEPQCGRCQKSGLRCSGPKQAAIFVHRYADSFNAHTQRAALSQAYQHRVAILEHSRQFFDTTMLWIRYLRGLLAERQWSSSLALDQNVRPSYKTSHELVYQALLNDFRPKNQGIFSGDRIEGTGTKHYSNIATCVRALLPLSSLSIPTLDLSLLSLLSLYYGSLHGDAGLEEFAYSSYTIALGQYSHLLTRFLSKDAKVSAAAATQSAEYRPHMQGALAALQASGPQPLLTSCGMQKAFCGLRGAAVFTAIEQREQTFFAEPDWLGIPFEHVNKSTRDHLTDLGVHIPNLLQCFDILSASTTTGYTALHFETGMSLLTQITDLEQKLEGWLSALETTTSEPLYWPRNLPTTHDRKHHDAECVPKYSNKFHQLVFHSGPVAGLLVHYWSFRLQLGITSIKLQQSLLSHVSQVPERAIFQEKLSQNLQREQALADDTAQLILGAEPSLSSCFEGFVCLQPPLRIVTNYFETLNSPLAVT